MSPKKSRASRRNLKNPMTTESKTTVLKTLAEWACNLKFEHLSDAAVQSAKLFWFDSMGCALGGSQQEDAKILLEHFREMQSTGPCTAFVSGYKSNPAD